jgi:hypothetical protein
LKVLIPRQLQIAMRRIMVRYKARINKRQWPIARWAGKRPSGFPGWPEGKQFAFILRHDVEGIEGHEKCDRILEIERRYGLISSFFFVPEGYNVSPDLRRRIETAGGEVGVHGLKHDGKLYNNRRRFDSRAVRINRYLSAWKAVGFSSPSMHHELDWLHALHIEYDCSTFDTDPFEPQPDAMHTIFPFAVRGAPGTRTFIELPYTLPQDFTVFILMRNSTVDIWKKKLDWVAAGGGMVLLNTHPDYMRFPGEKTGRYTYPARLYREFLEYVQREYAGRFWNTVPREVAAFWRSR